MEVITRADQLGVKHARGDEEDGEVPQRKKARRGRKPKKNNNKNASKKSSAKETKDKKNNRSKSSGKNKEEIKDKKNVTAAEGAPDKMAKKPRKSSSSKAPQASSPVKPLEPKNGNKRKSGQQVEKEPKLKRQIKDKTEKVENEEKHVPNTFARRYCPEGGIGKKKWCGIVGAFSDLIVPNLAVGTKTKAEVDFWKFATQFHKDNGNASEEKIMANVFAKAAREFLTFLDAVPLAKLV